MKVDHKKEERYPSTKFPATPRY